MGTKRRLSTLMAGLSVKNDFDGSIEINSIQFNSKHVKEQDLFVAIKGSVVDGHDYIDKAVSQGAIAVVCQHLPEKQMPGVAFLLVEDTEEILGQMASRFYNEPSHKLTLVGVTGTNGKTTVATLLYQLFKNLGYKCGLLSTVCNYVDNRAVEATHTTPDAIALNALLNDMVESGCEYAFMEVSSHAVVQRRISGLRFAGGIFTNLTRDHMDYHITFDNYLKAKKRFFDELPQEAFALTNMDDRNGMVMLQNCKAKKYTYSLRSMADFKTRILESTFEGMLLSMNDREISLPFVGRFNAYNLTAIFGTAVLLGFDQDEVLCRLSKLKAVSGRFETMKSPEGITAIVDYAHTPDALANVIHTINDIREGAGQLITVVGCGGNRDKGKRPLMTREAITGSERVVLTSDNPRFEDPQVILSDMTHGLDPMSRRKVLVIVDREEAIRTACALAQPGDVVLVAGKGHENYQIVNGVKSHFDDHEIIADCFKE